MNNKYEKLTKLIKNGDICEFKTWDNKIYFAFYMDGYLYKKQENGLIVAIGGYEHNIVAIRRPECLRNAFQCFVDGDIYNYDYSKYGAFKTVYDETEYCKDIRNKYLQWLRSKGRESVGLHNVVISTNGNVPLVEKRIATQIEIYADDWTQFCKETGVDYDAIKIVAII